MQALGQKQSSKDGRLGFVQSKSGVWGEVGYSKICCLAPEGTEPAETRFEEQFGEIVR